MAGMSHRSNDLSFVIQTPPWGARDRRGCCLLDDDNYSAADPSLIKCSLVRYFLAIGMF